MGRRRKETAKMGKALIKDRFGGKHLSRGEESFLHTTELIDGCQGKSLNLQSITDQSSMADFLMTAEMAGRDFTAEKENIQLVTPHLNSGVLSGEKLKKVKDAQDSFQNLLRIPRRPPWQESTSADKLRQDEHMSFLDWRRKLARLQEEEHIVITPYEKNLEFWRQLWRVIERSDVVVQIVDARNPLLFWCPDVDRYVREVDPRKQTLLLINKADLLTLNQRQAWAEYFASQGVHVVFWSAVEEAARLERETSTTADERNKPDEDSHRDDSDDSVDDDNDDENDQHLPDTAVKDSEETGVKDDVSSENTDVGDEESDEKDTSNAAVKETQHFKREEQSNEENDGEDDIPECDDDDDNSDDYDTIEEYTDDEEEAEDSVENAREDVKVVEEECGGHTDAQAAGRNTDCSTASPDQSGQGGASQVSHAVAVADSSLQTTDQLLALLRGAAKVNHMQGVTTVGMVGYPNVGKSSTINTLLHTKKVAVSTTPGRTKHFQTLYVDTDLMLCDCPGLVFPSFVNSKAELVVNGILPIDQLQDSEPPVELVCHRVGRSALEALYRLNLPPAEEWEDPDKAPSAYDLLQAYGALRGFMSHKGNPDRPRAARCILKDFVQGKLLFCHPPPGIEEGDFQKPPYGAPREFRTVPKPSTQKTASEKRTEALNLEFFAQKSMKGHVVGPRAGRNMQQARTALSEGHLSESSTPQGSHTCLAGKPWKKHHNHNRKEKLRRVYKVQDQC